MPGPSHQDGGAARSPQPKPTAQYKRGSLNLIDYVKIKVHADCNGKETLIELLIYKNPRQKKFTQISTEKKR